MPRCCHGCLPTLVVLIAQAVFLLQLGQTDKQTRLNALPHAGGCTAGVCNWKKPALTRVPLPTPAMFLCLVAFTIDILTPKINEFPGLMIEHTMSSLVILAASVLTRATLC